jgi:polyisoprenoid-binding protein YceI
VNGTLGAATGKRLVMPADLFESASTAKFSQEKRETAVDFEYPQSIQDALRITFKQGFEVEAIPKGDKYPMDKRALYTISVDSTPTSFTTRRAFLMGEIIFATKDYPELRTFYSQLQTKDKESVVLKMTPVTASSTTPAKAE